MSVVFWKVVLCTIKQKSLDIDRAMVGIRMDKERKRCDEKKVHIQKFPL